MKGKLAIVGAGGHAREALEAARAAGWTVVCVLDDDPGLWGRTVLDVPVSEGGIAAVGSLDPEIAIIVGVGDNRARQTIAERLGDRAFATLIHPFTWISPGAEIAPGAVVYAGAVVQPGACIGRHAIVNTGATVSHDSQIGDFAHLAVGAHLAGGVEIGQGVLMGAGAVARPGVAVGDWTVVGAGAAVVADLPPGVTAFGGGKAIPR